jgi:hypothetical protein
MNLLSAKPSFVLLALAIPSVSAALDLTGQWRAERNGVFIANCSIVQSGQQLEFIIHRQPEERSRGHFVNATTVVAEDWREQAGIAENGNVVRWRNSEWRRSAAPASLTGAWVHSADPRAHTADSKVIVVQEGATVTLTHAYRTGGRWVTAVCHGSLAGASLPLRCRWAPGGNPLSFADFSLDLKLSADANHLDGTLSSRAGNQQSHYSRVP